MRESNHPKAGFVSIEGRDSIPTGLDAEALFHQLRDAGVAVTGFFNPPQDAVVEDDDVALFDFHAADLALRDQEAINREDCKVIAGLIDDLKYRTNSDWNAQMDVVMGKVQVSGPMCAGGSQKGYYASFAEAKSALRALLAFLGPKPERMKAQAGEPPEARTASEWKASVAADRARENAMRGIVHAANGFTSNTGGRGGADFSMTDPAGFFPGGLPKDHGVLTINAPGGLVQRHVATPAVAEQIMDAVEAATRPGDPERFEIGDATMSLVFRPIGETNLSNLQKVLDRVEFALRNGGCHSPVLAATSKMDAARIAEGGVPDYRVPRQDWDRMMAAGIVETARMEEARAAAQDAGDDQDSDCDQDGEAEAPTASGATNGRVELVLYVDDNRVAEINDLTKLAQIMPQLIEGLTNVGSA